MNATDPMQRTSSVPKTPATLFIIIPSIRRHAEEAALAGPARKVYCEGAGFCHFPQPAAFYLGSTGSCSLFGISPGPSAIPQRSQLGNLQQALSHLALVRTTRALTDATYPASKTPVPAT